MNLPNKITLTRIFMIPVFVAVFYCGLLTEWCFLAAAVVFLAAALTDALDGHIARSRGLVTNLGKFLDPIADKVLVSTAFILLLTLPAAFCREPFGTYGLIAAGICVALILARELIVSGFRMIAAGKNLVLAADKLGKVKTVFQDAAIAVLLLSMSFAGEAARIISYIGLALFIVCTVLTVLSGVNYIVKNRQVLKDSGTNGKPEKETE